MLVHLKPLNAQTVMFILLNVKKKCGQSMRQSAISTNALGNIAAPSLTIMATLLILLLPLHISTKFDLNNYRPFSVISVMAKDFERIVYDQLYAYLEEHNIICKYQSGFRAIPRWSVARAFAPVWF